MSTYNELPENFLRGDYWRDKSAPRPDFEINDIGSMAFLQPMTEAGYAWSEQQLPHDKLMFNGAVVIEPRYIGDLVEGIKADGLTVKVN